LDRLLIDGGKTDYGPAQPLMVNLLEYLMIHVVAH